MSCFQKKTYPAQVGEYILHHSNVLGIGGFGRVVLGTHKCTGERVAVKIIDREFIRKHQLEEYVKTETKILGAIRHRHVVHLLKVMDTDQAMYIVTELACKGELFDKIVVSKRFAESVARRYFQQIISAVYACHERGICHRDLKAENLLLDDNDELKVCDFGLSRCVDLLTDRPIMLHSQAGSTDYQCPEMLDGRDGGYDGRKADLWASSVILCFMLSGYLPFAGNDDKDTEARILRGSYRLASDVSDDVKCFIKRNLNVDPTRRMTMDQILLDPWFLESLDPDLFPEAAMSPCSPTSPLSPLRVHRACEATASDLLIDITRAFDALDVTSSGVIHREEIRDVLVMLNNGSPVDPMEVDAMMKVLDQSGTGAITRDDFIVAFTASAMPRNTDLQRKFELERLADLFHFHVEAKLLKELRAAFDAIDTERTGVITKCQLLKSFEKAGVALSERDQQEILRGLKMVDKCTFDEFALAITERHVLLEGRVGALMKQLNVLHGLVTYEQATMYHKRGGFTALGFRDTIQQAIVKRLPERNPAIEMATSASGLVHAVRRDPTNGKIVCEVNIILLPAAKGYTKVDATRLCGSTPMYHEVLRELLEALASEKEEADADTETVGEAEEV